MKTLNKYVGLDVHKDTPVIAMAEGQREGEVRTGFDRRWAASCGKLFGSCPRKRPIASLQEWTSTFRHPRFRWVALQT